MTGPDGGDAITRPVSVAELLAKNGTIGSPMAGGGRRRRRRGKSDAVTVAELTGELPIVGGPAYLTITGERSGGERDAAGVDTATLGPDGAAEDADQAAAESPADAADDAPDADVVRAEALADADAAAATAGTGAELMSPDPVDDSMIVIYPAVSASGAVEDSVEPTVTRGIPAGADGARPDRDTLFGGGPVDGEPPGEIRAGPEVSPAGQAADAVDAGPAFGEHQDQNQDEDQNVFAEDYTDGPSRGRVVLRGVAVVAESVLALAFGAGLFLAFDELWAWNSLVAMVLAVLVTLGLVAGVWAVRKTEDITSTLFAVGVGLLVTFGPMALMHAK